MDFHQKAACCIWVICIGAALCVEIQDDWIDPLDPLSHDPSKIEKDYKKYMDSKNQRDLTKDADSNKEVIIFPLSFLFESVNINILGNGVNFTE